MIFQARLWPAALTTSRFSSALILQRKCACGGTMGPTGECEECKAKKKRLQRRARGGQETTDFAPGAHRIVQQALRSPGESLDEGTRGFMEPRLGHDFSAVRIHRGPEANAAAQAVNAAAFTIGRDIVMADSFYEPASSAGRQLLAHELVHTIQQSSTRDARAGSFEVGGVNDSAELEADRVANSLTTRGTASTDGLSRSAPQLARKDCSKVPARTCKGIYKCGYGDSGTCWMMGDKCECKGASRPPLARVLAVLGIIGISIGLVYLIIAAVADPEPVTKLALIGLTAAQIALLLSLLGFDMSGPEETSAQAGEQPSGEKPAAAIPSEATGKPR